MVMLDSERIAYNNKTGGLVQMDIEGAQLPSQTPEVKNENQFQFK